MPRYVALLRGVSPLNAKMSELKRCFEAAGYTDVKTVLGSGNVVFSARQAAVSTLERRIEAAMAKHLDRTFYPIVRPIAALDALLKADPYAAFRLPSEAKRVVTFMRRPPQSVPKLPVELDGARILAADGAEVFSAYVPGPRGPVFMGLIERTFGSDVTTRTWDSVRKCVVAGQAAS